jgi:hypothetical protein
MKTEEDQEYEDKEAARLAVVQALQIYKDAAEAYGLDESGIGDELECALADIGLSNLEIVCG